MDNRLSVIPTGNEILQGTVLDTDSPEIRSLWLEQYPDDRVTIGTVARDETEEITERILDASPSADIIVLIGGSGGGHRHDASLGKDYTHTALDRLLEQRQSQSIYGPNGHLWCRLSMGFLEDTLVLNVPGPFTEAKAAFTAFRDCCREYGIPQRDDSDSVKRVNIRMADAVVNTYLL